MKPLLPPTAQWHRRQKKDSVNHAGPSLPDHDTLLMDKMKTSFNVTRSKTVKDVDKEIKFGNSVMHMKMDNASFSATTKIEIADAYWETVNKNFDHGNVILDMKSVTALQIGEDEKIGTGNPGYLETKKYPAALLVINGFDSVPGNAKQMQVKAKLTIKDSTADITFPAKIEFADAAHAGVPTKLSGSFHIDGVKWGLNPKNAKVVKDDLKFDVVLVTK
jgi:polyisoprenoid-binding protein YceI